MLKKNLLICCLLFFFFSSFPAHSHSKPVLTVYTYSSFASDWGPGPAIKLAFESECGCTLRFITLDNGVSLLNRLRMEGINAKADIVLGFDNNLMAEAEKTGLFAPVQVDTSALHIPGGWNNSLFIPYDYGYFAFIYDNTRLKDPPKSLLSLVENKQNWRVIYQDPRTSTPGLGLLLWMRKVFGENTPEAWIKLSKKTLTVTKGWSEAYQLFLKGEADLVLSYSTSPVVHLINENNPHYAAADFTEGHYVQVEVAGLLKNSQHPELAQRFMRFIVSPSFQRHIPTGNWMYPVINLPLPKGFETLKVPKKALEYSSKQVADNRAKWIKEWQEAVSR